MATYPEVYIPSNIIEISKQHLPKTNRFTETEEKNNTFHKKTDLEITVIIIVTSVIASFIVAIVYPIIFVIIVIILLTLIKLGCEPLRLTRKFVKFFLYSDQNQKIRQSLTNTVPPDICTTDQNKSHHEECFKKYLERYFPQKIFIDRGFKLPNHTYIADFCYIHQNLHIDIEIDEPYQYDRDVPQHYIECSEQEKRNQLFLDKGWIVIRFSEKQIVQQPKSCCKKIAQVIEKLTGENIPEILRKTPDLKIDRRWTQKHAQKMITQKYRDTYLKNDVS